MTSMCSCLHNILKGNNDDERTYLLWVVCECIKTLGFSGVKGTKAIQERVFLGVHRLVFDFPWLIVLRCGFLLFLQEYLTDALSVNLSSSLAEPNRARIAQLLNDFLQ